jgi:small-conductance mechanosensitive channel
MDIVTANAGVSPEAVLALLETTAAAVPGVAASPAPEAVLAKFTAASLTFELRLWTSDLPQIALLRSRLAIALNKALTDAGIPVV